MHASNLDRLQRMISSLLYNVVPIKIFYLNSCTPNFYKVTLISNWNYLATGSLANKLRSTLSKNYGL